jgi:polyphosphate glucokinase
MKVLAIDVGGTHVKILASGESESRRFDSGSTLTAEQMAVEVKKLATGWVYKAISIGYPGPVLHGKPVHEPFNLAPGWVGFDFESAFHCPVKIVNDAAMQALGSYNEGRMPFWDWVRDWVRPWWLMATFNQWNWDICLTGRPHMKIMLA